MTIHVNMIVRAMVKGVIDGVITIQDDGSFDGFYTDMFNSIPFIPFNNENNGLWYSNPSTNKSQKVIHRRRLPHRTRESLLVAKHHARDLLSGLRSLLRVEEARSLDRRHVLLHRFIHAELRL